MTGTIRELAGVLVVATIATMAMGGCAGTPTDLLRQPDVSLSNVEVKGLSFNEQTFVLTFDISNPNPFPLPVNELSYDVRLDGYRFASGHATSDLSIPAAGETEISLSVELDLLRTAPQIVSVVREGATRPVPYELRGQFALDLPLTPAVAYSNHGTISVR